MGLVNKGKEEWGRLRGGYFKNGVLPHWWHLLLKALPSMEIHFLR